MGTIHYIKQVGIKINTKILNMHKNRMPPTCIQPQSLKYFLNMGNAGI